MENRGRNTTFSSFLLKYRGQNTTFSSFLLKYRVETIQIFERPEKGGSKWRSVYSNLHRVSTPTPPTHTPHTPHRALHKLGLAEFERLATRWFLCYWWGLFTELRRYHDEIPRGDLSISILLAFSGVMPLVSRDCCTEVQQCNAVPILNETQQSIDQSHRYGRPRAPCREPAGSCVKTTRTAICFEHKTQYLLIRAPHTRIVVFWHISNKPPMISQSQINCNTHTFYIAAIFAKYCYTTGSWLL